MKHKYTILESFEQVGAYKFAIYDILKTSYLFKFRGKFYFSIFGEIINREPFNTLTEAIDFIKTKHYE